MAKEEKHKRTILIVILCFLLVVIVLFVLLILFNSKEVTNDNANQDVMCDSISLEIVQTCANQIANGTDNDYTSIISYYNERIKSALEAEDYPAVRKLIANRSEFFALRNDCEKAFELIDDINVDVFPNEQKAFLYSSFADISTECADSTRYAQYEKNLKIVKEEIPNALGF